MPRIAKKALILAMSGLWLGGCASLPLHANGRKDAHKEAQKVMLSKGWTTPPLMHAYGAPVVLVAPPRIPKDILSRKLNLNLNNHGTYAALAVALGQLHLPTFLGSQKLASKSVTIPYYQGSLGNLLTALSRIDDVFFTWDGSSIIVQSKAAFSASIPQSDLLIKKVSQELSELGASDVTLSRQTGTVNFKASPAAMQAIRPYLAELNTNSALVTLRVAVLSVQLTSAHDTGIDWGALEAAVSPGLLTSPLSSLISGLPSGGGSAFSAPAATSPSTGTGTTGTGTTGTGTTGTGNSSSSTGTGTGLSSSSSSTPTGTSLALSGSGLQLTMNNPSFSFSGVLQFLDTYGKTSTLQNVLVRTLGGTPVKLENNTEIPYVSNVGVGAVGSNSASTSVGTASTSNANSGITLTLKPDYNHQTGQVTVSVKVKLDAVLGFNQLSAGSQLGSLTQPTTQKEALTDIVELLPGQATIIGGLRYRTLSDNRQGLPWLAQHGGASVNRQLTDEELVIILRPTVTVFDKKLPAYIHTTPVYANGHAQLDVSRSASFDQLPKVVKHD